MKTRIISTTSAFLVLTHSLFLLILLCSSMLCSANSHSEESSEEKKHHNHNEIVQVPSALERSAQEMETHFEYMNPKKSAHFTCANVNESSLPDHLKEDNIEAVKWYKTVPNPPGKQDMSQKCFLYTGDDDDDNDEKKKCSYIYSKNKNNTSEFYSTLRFRELEKEDYGNYTCNVNNVVLRKFVLRGEFRVTRKSLKDTKETERSVFVTEGQLLHLYCNYSEGGVDNFNISKVDFVKVSWFRIFENQDNTDNKTDITQDLKSPSENSTFKGFEEISPNEFRGPAIYAHRGEYICSINVANPSKLIVHPTKMYPVEFKFTVRVRNSYEWMVPGGILLAEIICMGLFTAFIWKRDEMKEINDDNAVPQDSDDDGEEETPNKLK